MRAALIDACRFDWAAISPAIFGALFQSVMEPAERRAQGAHYTTEKNILKVIEPLFLDDLRAEFNRLRARKDSRRRAELRAFQKRLGEMKFFDPACGCGNFLIIAYRELRELEIELIRELRRGRGDETQRALDTADLSRITVDQFYGIEIGEFPARIAETALWMMDHIMNNRLSLAFGQSYVRIPLEGSAHILNADALETDWTALLPPEDCSFVFGNPPFGGAKFQDTAQRAQVCRIAARGKAHVHVVIVGLDRREDTRADKHLFSYPDINGEPEETLHAVLSPYLFDGGALANPHIVIREEGRPINGLVQLLTGSQPIDDGHYIFNVEERLAFLDAEPDAEPFLRPFVGAREYLQGSKRWILALHDAPPATLARLPSVRARIAAVRAYRRTSKRTSTLKLADTPTLWQVNVLPTALFLVLPEVSSERREYLPVGWLEPPAIPSNKLRLLSDATLADFALLTSAMHMAWMRAVTGRMKSDYMYSVGVVYNTFPTPPGSADRSKLETLAQVVLDARAAHPGATLTDLYDPDLMPPNLRRAHQALDRAVDRLYRPAGFASERERVEHLFMLYEKMCAPLEALMKAKPKRRRTRRKSTGASR